MVVQISRDDEIDLIFQALADTTRRDIMSRVVLGEQVVHGNPDRMTKARILLNHFESLWRARADSIESVLADAKT